MFFLFVLACRSSLSEDSGVEIEIRPEEDNEEGVGDTEQELQDIDQDGLFSKLENNASSKRSAPKTGSLSLYSSNR